MLSLSLPLNSNFPSVSKLNTNSAERFFFLLSVYCHSQIQVSFEIIAYANIICKKKQDCPLDNLFILCFQYLKVYTCISFSFSYQALKNSYFSKFFIKKKIFVFYLTPYVSSFCWSAHLEKKNYGRTAHVILRILQCHNCGSVKY